METVGGVTKCAPAVRGLVVVQVERIHEREAPQVVDDLGAQLVLQQGDVTHLPPALAVERLLQLFQFAVPGLDGGVQLDDLGSGTGRLGLAGSEAVLEIPQNALQS
ncbi:TMV resistance protein N, putative [Babesia caballi]|uniref:TMV resistance protein N, putative n=1 Tax=Babesia caballi TaxID=5871 RepID=A0AAV4M1A3_BABCB|nr:TMV resistance protein N, putative [Babesia caballi]